MDRRDLGIEARRSTRIVLKVPVSISTRTSNESIDAWTLVINRQGARLQSKKAIGSNQKIGLAMHDGRTALGRVIWADAAPNYAGYFEFGVELDEPTNLFDVSFPPEDLKDS